jgi:hypothetical protein
MSLFKKEGELTGTVEIADVPPFLGYSIALSLFRVNGPDAPPPPPLPDVALLESRQDEEKLSESIHFNQEDTTGHLCTGFRLRRPAGWYYLLLNVILFRKQDETLYAQVEWFPFLKRPVEIPPSGQNIVLPVPWPAIPIEELEYYGTMEPGDPGQLQ